MSNQNFSYSIKKIISLFNDIDNKILNLNDSSGKDFMILNNVQKNYYKHLKILSENISAIKNLEIVNGLGEEIEKSNKSLSSISNYLNESGTKNSNLLVSLKNITNKIAVLKIVINNIAQTNTTLKLLGTSQLLNLTFSNNKTKFETESELSAIDDFISKIKAKSKEIKASIKIFNTDIIGAEQLVITNLKTISNLNGKLIIEINNIESLYELKNCLSDDFSAVSEVIVNSFKNSNEVIVKLQYHDIIRQKMEHIQLLLKEIVEELDNTKLEKDTEELVKFNTKYVAQIPKIAMLQTGQLIKINTEFQTATTSIVKNLNSTAENILNVLSSLSEFDINSINTDLTGSREKVLKKFSEGWQKLDKKNILLQNFIVNIVLTCVDFIEYFDQLDILSDTIIEKISNIINKKTIKYPSKKQFLPSDQYFQNILDSLNDSKNDLGSLKDDFIQFKDNLNDYHEFINQQIYQNSEFKGKVSEIESFYEYVISDLKKYLEINISNNEIKNFFATNQNENIDSINYYDYYNLTVGELIISLKKIIIILSDEDFDLQQLDIETSKDIEVLKEKYTVGSEYKVHENMFTDEKELKDNTENIAAGDDGEIELF